MEKISSDSGPSLNTACFCPWTNLKSTCPLYSGIYSLFPEWCELSFRYLWKITVFVTPDHQLWIPAYSTLQPPTTVHHTAYSWKKYFASLWTWISSPPLSRAYLSGTYRNPYIDKTGKRYPSPLCRAQKWTLFQRTPFSVRWNLQLFISGHCLWYAE